MIDKHTPGSPMTPSNCPRCRLNDVAPELLKALVKIATLTASAPGSQAIYALAVAGIKAAKGDA